MTQVIACDRLSEKPHHVHKHTYWNVICENMQAPGKNTQLAGKEVSNQLNLQCILFNSDGEKS